jgi:hypothetical protein
MTRTSVLTVMPGVAQSLLSDPFGQGPQQPAPSAPTAVKYDLPSEHYPVIGYNGRIALIKDPYYGRTMYGTSQGRVFENEQEAIRCQMLIDQGKTRAETMLLIPQVPIGLQTVGGRTRTPNLNSIVFRFLLKRKQRGDSWRRLLRIEDGFCSASVFCDIGTRTNGRRR